ncbi:YdbH domain-containing protein [Sphingomonas immobilis]|uniref:YdbH domain-containing protein n=1 Tax=Sphingomonas immobilis TaxID=3063997 RepID=A0ABT9A020_9SPHN|nr:YdbH domain-containing protein [Sphingomonas sp. CA1-15]MDO7842600.1 YdbH domain-containing protein [Sphingomonas sp. CA1-15]
MTADRIDEPDAQYRSRWGFARLRRVLLVAALLLLVALIALWTQRKQIARGYADRFLAGQQVPGRYEIADLGFSRQRLTNVVLGDPAHPDLVADWVELDTAISTGGAQVRGVRAGRVRTRARLVNGALSFGALDRLLPKATGAPFALPAIRLGVEDGRMRIEAPQGVVGVKLSGSGLLSDGFAGRVAVVTRRWKQAGCDIADAQAAFSVTVASGASTLKGPVRARAIACGGIAAASPAVTLSLRLGKHLESWAGNARLAVASVERDGMRAAALGGRIGFNGTAKYTGGTAQLGSGAFAAGGVGGKALTLRGQYGFWNGGAKLNGRIEARAVSASAATLHTLAAYRETGAGTPLAPIVQAIADAGAKAARAADLSTDLSVALGTSNMIAVPRIEARAASGAYLSVGGGSGLHYGWPNDGVRIDTAVMMGGGGLPDARVTLAQAPGGAAQGVATIAPYQAGGARIALAPVRFSATPGGNTHVETIATLSGPLAGGRVDELRAPLSLYWNGRDRVIVNPSCTPLSVRRVAVSSLDLDPARLSLCPQGAGLVTLLGGRLGGGARLAAAKLTGTMGGAPLSLAASGGSLRLSDSGFTLAGVAARLGPADRQTRLDFAKIEGGAGKAGLGGRLSGGGGQIANVPLLLSAAAGDWRFAAGRLGLTGTLAVADAVTDAPRFKPLAADAVALDLTGGRISVRGMLAEPATRTKVADVAILHDLNTATGHADLTVPGISFGKDFQPDQITPLTFGVIAAVVGTVSGEGHIRWDKAGVTSDGSFGTGATDLAAAFGTVSGISGTIRFTDLLTLQSAPGQIVRIKTINPGVPVSDGTIRLQLLPGTRVKIEDGRWPFAGGALVLEPTVLDFAQPVERRMTFRVSNMDAGLFLQQFEFKNLDATGTFAGVLPMIFDSTGGRIENGNLSVTSGEGGTIAYVGEVSQKDVGFWGNLAFQSLKSLRYKRLGIEMNGPLAGEMITQVRFAGVAQGEGTKRNFLLDRLQKLPLVFNVTIKAPFRQLIDSAQSFYDPRRLIERNLPALLEEQKKKRGSAPKPVQPPASENAP